MQKFYWYRRLSSPDSHIRSHTNSHIRCTEAQNVTPWYGYWLLFQVLTDSPFRTQIGTGLLACIEAGVGGSARAQSG